MELFDEAPAMPLTDAEDQINVFLQCSVIEVFQDFLITRIACPIDHPWRNATEEKRIEGPERNHDVPRHRCVIGEEFVIVGIAGCGAILRRLAVDRYIMSKTREFARHINDAALTAPERLSGRRRPIEDQ